jgi:hypothetical protein
VFSTPKGLDQRAYVVFLVELQERSRIFRGPAMHDDDFSKYELMKASGSSAEQVWLEAVRDNVDKITRIRLIRAVFCLTLVGAKEVQVRAEGLAGSLEQHQEKFIEPVKDWLAYRRGDATPSG